MKFFNLYLHAHQEEYIRKQSELLRIPMAVIVRDYIREGIERTKQRFAEDEFLNAQAQTDPEK